ncbi:hypothetical protein BHE74_00058699 [Ensete ventricosum]|nr:hypothetical protein BHE74_00058699 [Ensete ventricosum]
MQHIKLRLQLLFRVVDLSWEELDPPLLKVVIYLHFHFTIILHSKSVGTDPCSYGMMPFTSFSVSILQCINNYGSDIRKCQFYSDMLNECRRGSLIISDLMIPRFKFID